MRRSIPSALLVTVMMAAPVVANAHGGDEAAFHSLPAATAPTLKLDVTAQDGGFLVHMTTTNFTWADAPEVGGFVSGSGIARVYFDDVKFAKVYGPEFFLAPDVFAPIPGEHSIVVALAGADMVSYASDGVEVETSVNVSTPAPAGPGATPIDSDSFAMEVTPDRFGGFTVSGTPGVNVSVDGILYTRTLGFPVHVAESERGVSAGPHELTFTAPTSTGDVLATTVQYSGGTLSVDVPSSVNWWWLLLGIAAGIAVMLIVLQMYWRHVRVAVTSGPTDRGSSV